MGHWFHQPIGGGHQLPCTLHDDGVIPIEARPRDAHCDFRRTTVKGLSEPEQHVTHPWLGSGNMFLILCSWCPGAFLRARLSTSESQRLLPLPWRPCLNCGHLDSLMTGVCGKVYYANASPADAKRPGVHDPPNALSARFDHGGNSQDVTLQGGSVSHILTNAVEPAWEPLRSTIFIIGTRCP